MTLRVLLGLIAMMLSGFAYSSDTLQMKPGWQYRVIADGLKKVDNVVLDQQGTIYVSLEAGKGEGQIVKLSKTGATLIQGGLNRPDGLFYHDKHLYLTEEVESGRIIRIGLETAKVTGLARLNRPEGIDRLSNGLLVIAEDAKPGRVLTLNPENGAMQVLGKLNRPEGLCVTDNDEIVVAETGAGRVLLVKDGRAKVLVKGLNEPDQVECGPNGVVWITEDAANGHLFFYKGGRVAIIAKGLNYPQGMALISPTRLYLAEQGADRLLLIEKTP